MNDYPGVDELLEAVAELETVTKAHVAQKRAAMREAAKAATPLSRHLYAVPAVPNGKPRASRR